MASLFSKPAWAVLLFGIAALINGAQPSQTMQSPTVGALSSASSTVAVVPTVTVSTTKNPATNSTSMALATSTAGPRNDNTTAGSASIIQTIRLNVEESAAVKKALEGNEHDRPSIKDGKQKKDEGTTLIKRARKSGGEPVVTFIAPNGKSLWILKATGDPPASTLAF